jgi:hypothetical protein
MRKKWFITFMLTGLCNVTVANALTKEGLAHGQLLYSTHCIACHSTQLHWREKKSVKNWLSLKAEVTKWQRESMLGWNEEDVADVANYLNIQYYHFPAPEVGRSGRSSTGGATTLMHQH